jgi:hypothetical protein
MPRLTPIGLALVGALSVSSVSFVRAEAPPGTTAAVTAVKAVKAVNLVIPAKAPVRPAAKPAKESNQREVNFEREYWRHHGVG